MVAASLLLSACGYRGPLYLPEDDPPQAPHAEAAGHANPSSPEQDAEDEDEKDQPR